MNWNPAVSRRAMTAMQDPILTRHPTLSTAQMGSLRRPPCADPLCIAIQGRCRSSTALERRACGSPAALQMTAALYTSTAKHAMCIPSSCRVVYLCGQVLQSHASTYRMRSTRMSHAFVSFSRDCTWVMSCDGACKVQISLMPRLSYANPDAWPPAIVSCNMYLVPMSQSQFGIFAFAFSELACQAMHKHRNTPASADCSW